VDLIFVNNTDFNIKITISAKIEQWRVQDLTLGGRGLCQRGGGDIERVKG